MLGGGSVRRLPVVFLHLGAWRTSGHHGFLTWRTSPARGPGERVLRRPFLCLRPSSVGVWLSFSGNEPALRERLFRACSEEISGNGPLLAPLQFVQLPLSRLPYLRHF